MKRIILDLAVSLDGFIEGPNGEIDWCIMEEDMNFPGFLDSIDTIFYGRVSYDLWGNFRPDEEAPHAEKALWTAVHAKEKFVFSSEDRKDDRATFISADIAGSVAKIQSKGGKDIWLYGGASLIRSFIDSGLVDIYRISVHPIALGSGKPLFEQRLDRLELQLLESKAFRSGVVQLIYAAQRPDINTTLKA